MLEKFMIAYCVFNSIAIAVLMTGLRRKKMWAEQCAAWLKGIGKYSLLALSIIFIFGFVWPLQQGFVCVIFIVLMPSIISWVLNGYEPVC